jgi:hypothetical protein
LLCSLETLDVLDQIERFYGGRLPISR